MIIVSIAFVGGAFVHLKVNVDLYFPFFLIYIAIYINLLYVVTG